MNIFSRVLWEQPFLDLWSVPHFMMGAVVALFFIYYLENGIYQGMVVVFLIAFVWEVLEHYVGIGEIFTNRTIDVILPLIALIGVYNLHRIFGFSQKFLLWSFVSGSFVIFMTSVLGWAAHILHR